MQVFIRGLKASKGQQWEVERLITNDSYRLFRTRLKMCQKNYQIQVLSATVKLSAVP